MDEDEKTWVRCGNLHCLSGRDGFVVEDFLHETGFCGGCCMRIGSLACRQCAWDDVDADD